MKINQEKSVAEAYYNEFVKAFRNKQYDKLKTIFDKYLEFVENTVDLSDKETSEIDLMFDRFIDKHRIIKKYLYRNLYRK